MPAAEIIVGECRPGPFNPSEAVNDAASRASGSVFCIHDSEIVLPAAWYARARVARTWVLPDGVRYLTPSASSRLQANPPETHFLPAWPEAEEIVAKPMGGAVMLPRLAFEAVGGKDDRFVGWGPEDVAFAWALETIWGPGLRFGGSMLHLWHPRLPNTRPWPDGVPELMCQYEDSIGNPAAMREVCRR